VRETASAMQCPEGTVKTLTYRAIALLREAGLLDDEEVLDV
jgi:DNA-directed RNA polymerase specialized sigma24 family protein